MARIVDCGRPPHRIAVPSLYSHSLISFIIFQGIYTHLRTQVRSHVPPDRACVAFSPDATCPKQFSESIVGRPWIGQSSPTNGRGGWARTHNQHRQWIDLIVRSELIWFTSPAPFFSLHNGNKRLRTCRINFVGDVVVQLYLVAARGVAVAKRHALATAAATASFARWTARA